jgi:WD40 repeat protein
MKALLWAPDEKSFLTAYSGQILEAKSIQFWDAAAMKPVGEPLPAVGDAHHFGRDGRTLLVVSKSEICLWDLVNRKPIGKLFTPEIAKRWIPWPQRRITDHRWAAVHPDATSVLFTDRAQAQLWDLSGETPQKKRVLEHAQNIYWVSIARDGKQAATACRDQILVWNLDTGKPLLRIPHDGQIRAMEFSPDSRLLATVKESGIQVWRVDAERR